MCTCWEIEFFVFLLLHHMAIIRACMCAQSLSHVRLCDPMDCSLIDSSVNGIFQARILEQVAISYSKRSSQSRYQTRISCMSWIGRQIFFFFLTTEPPGKPCLSIGTNENTPLMLEHPASPNPSPTSLFYFLSLEAQISDSYFHDYL